MARSKKAKPTLDDLRDKIDPELRAEILDRLIQSRIEDAFDFNDFVDTMTFVMAHILVGDIAVERAEVLKQYFEMLFTAVAANKVSGTAGGSRAEAIRKAREAAREPKKLEAKVGLVLRDDGTLVPEGLTVGRAGDRT